MFVPAYFALSSFLDRPLVFQPRLCASLNPCCLCFPHPRVPPLAHLRYITQESHKLMVEQTKPPMAVTNAVSWRSEGIKYRKNEVFLDVIESVNLLVCMGSMCMFMPCALIGRGPRAECLLSEVYTRAARCRMAAIQS